MECSKPFQLNQGLLAQVPWHWAILLGASSLPGDPTVLPLCAGAYGTVYKALRDGVQVVAVKKFHHLEDPRQQRSIMKEVSILKGCR